MNQAKQPAIKSHRKDGLRIGTDVTLVFAVLFLIVFGIIMIYSSSYYASFELTKNLPNPTHTVFFKKQLLWSCIGVFLMLVISKIPLSFINRFWLLIYLVSMGLLVFVLFTAPIKGSRRWLDLGIINFQPSELAKLAMIIVISLVLSNTYKHIANWKVFSLNFILFIMIPVGLIGIENLSTSIVAFSIGGAMIFVSFPSFKTIIKYFVLLLVVALIAFMIYKGIKGDDEPGDKEYRNTRIETWLNGPWSDPQGAGYQTIQSLYAIGSGGLFGKGLGYSMQKNGFIPEAHNDIIFSIVCEELGLFGAIALILLFLLLIWRCMVIATRAKSVQGLLIVTGVMVQIAIQVIINIAVVTGSIPTTGMPLPFISYGGSSLSFLMIEVGLVLNVARQSHVVG